jgi:hypothetical protein
MSGRRRMRSRRGNLTAALLVGLGALGLGAACTTKGDGLILVRLTYSQPLDHARVLVAAPGGQAALAMAMADWPATPPLDLGIYIAKGDSGPVHVIACGFDGDGKLVASTPDNPASFTATAEPGVASAIVLITLAPGSAPPLCGTLGTGGTGGSGPGGSAGGGTGGTSGAGGTGGGAGGVAGTGGMSGAGGGAASGGGAGGGTAGTAGTGGGTAGTGGGGTAGTGATWRGAVALSTVVGQQTFPSVAVDANGRAVVAYEQGAHIWANDYDVADGWGTPRPIDMRGSVCCKPSVAVDKNGNWLVVWGMATSSALRGIWYSTSTTGTNWEPPQSITTTIAYSPVLAMNANGMAIVAWTEQPTAGGATQAAAAVRTAPGMNWSTQVLRPADNYSNRQAAVAVTGNGNAFVGWEQSDGLGNGWNSLWMRQYTLGVGWANAELFETYTERHAYGVNFAANAAGDAIGTYIQITNANPPTVQLWARRFNNGAFAPPALIFDASSIDNYVPPSVTLDEAGTATVAFAVQTSTGYQVQTSRTSRTQTTWPPAPTSMETNNVAKDDDPADDLASVTMPVVRSDPAGNVTLVWRKRTAAGGKRFDLVSRRYTAGSAWGPEVMLESNTTNSVLFPTLAVGPDGTAITTWHFETSLDVWANVWR